MMRERNEEASKKSDDETEEESGEEVERKRASHCNVFVSHILRNPFTWQFM